MNSACRWRIPPTNQVATPLHFPDTPRPDSLVLYSQAMESPLPTPVPAQSATHSISGTDIRPYRRGIRCGTHDRRPHSGRNKSRLHRYFRTHRNTGLRRSRYALPRTYGHKLCRSPAHQQAKVSPLTTLLSSAQTSMQIYKKTTSATLNEQTHATKSKRQTNQKPGPYFYGII